MQLEAKQAQSKYSVSARYGFKKFATETLHFRLAIFQLLDDTERLTPYLAFISFCTGCLNVPLDLLLLGGAIFRQSCGLMPWIVVTLVVRLLCGGQWRLLTRSSGPLVTFKKK